MAGSNGTKTELSEKYYLTAKYFVEIQGIAVAAFMECSGLEVKTETMTYKEGGLNTFVHTLPVRTSFSNLMLKRGFTDSSVLWDWYMKTAEGKREVKSISVILYSADEVAKATKRWEITGAYPIKWAGPKFSIKSNEFLVEELEIAYQFFKIVDA